MSKGRELVVSKIIDEFNYFLRTQLTCFFTFGRLFVGQERNKKQLSLNGMNRITDSIDLYAVGQLLISFQMKSMPYRTASSFMLFMNDQ